jgi:hypothetical protein
MQAAEINCILAYKKVPNCQLFFNTSDNGNYRKKQYQKIKSENHSIFRYRSKDLYS